ncbi:unnamed protein product [Periconia digitata]|uniref:BTB domain-containing protein n=1 Tax=Periconia digitata TaxID=1303443 RepID=A0A9W4XFK0_9PLEO|nr:unnamed protein product [Periconia digitata]
MESQDKILRAGIKELLVSEKFSDVTVLCGADKYKLHKAIMCTQVPFFASAIRFKKEGKDAIIELHGEDPLAVAAVVDFVYKSDYKPLMLEDGEDHRWKFDHAACQHHEVVCDPDTCLFECSTCSKLVWGKPEEMSLHINVYQLADMYQISNLKQLAFRNFQNTASDFWDTKEFVEAVHSVGRSDHDELKEVIIATVLEHLELLEKEDFALVLEEYSALSMRILKRCAKELTHKRNGATWDMWS